MAAPFTLRAGAKRDLAALYGWLEREAGTDTAEQTLASAHRSFLMLSERPGVGPDIGSANVRLTGLRKWRMDGFPRLLIFYAPAGRRIAIIRVLHAAQDWWSLLDLG